MSLTLLKGPAFLFGIPAKPIVLRGFDVVAKAGEWTFAKQGNRRFYMGPHRGGYRLYPIGSKGEARTDRSIFIPDDSEVSA